jgi:WD40 repeat protein
MADTRSTVQMGGGNDVDVEEGTCLSTLRGHTGHVLCVLQLSNGRLVSGSYDSTLIIWDVSSGTCLSTLRGHTARVTCVLQLSDGRLVSGNWDNTLKLWDVSSGLCLRP